MLEEEELRWDQHDARPALSSRRQRTHAGPEPPRHSTTLPTNAPSPAGPTLSFLAGRRNRPASFFAADRSPPGPRASSEARAKGRMSQAASMRAAPATTFVAELRPGPTQPGSNAKQSPTPTTARLRATCRKQRANGKLQPPRVARKQSDRAERVGYKGC